MPLFMKEACKRGHYEKLPLPMASRRTFREYVIIRKLLTVEQGLHKLAGLLAGLKNLTTRGRITKHEVKILTCLFDRGKLNGL